MALYTYICPSGHHSLVPCAGDPYGQTPYCRHCRQGMRPATVGPFAAGPPPRISHPPRVSRAPFQVLESKGNTFSNCAKAFEWNGGMLLSRDDTFIDCGKIVEAKNAIVRMKNTTSRNSKPK